MKNLGTEVDEISDEDLEAAAEFYDAIQAEFRASKNTRLSDNTTIEQQ